jgi:hypothetical protein
MVVLIPNYTERTDLNRPPLRLCVVALHVSKAFRSAFLWHALARDDFELALAPGLLVLGLDKATI